MGELVSLCKYRRDLAREEKEAERREIEELMQLVDAWVEFIGKPQQEPFFVALEEQLRAEDWLDDNLEDE